MEIKLSKRRTLVRYIVDKVGNDGQRAVQPSALERSHSLFFKGEKNCSPVGQQRPGFNVTSLSIQLLLYVCCTQMHGV